MNLVHWLNIHLGKRMNFITQIADIPYVAVGKWLTKIFVNVLTGASR